MAEATVPSGGPGADPSASASAGGSSPPFEKHLQDGIEHLGIEIDGGLQQGGFSWGSSPSWASDLLFRFVHNDHLSLVLVLSLLDVRHGRLGNFRNDGAAHLSAAGRVGWMGGDL